MNALLQKQGIPLVVLVFPVSEQLDRATRERDEPRVLYPQRRIREICEAHGIPMLDLTATLERNGGKELFKDYLHLNGKGNDVVADQVEEFLASRVGQMVGMKAE
jgi:lysophospholipase L1-like esterase